MNYPENIHSDVRKSLDYIEKLLKSNRYDLIKDNPQIPFDKGIYMFFFKDSADKNVISYIGSATGKKGLYQRISGNHLRKSYTKSVFKKYIIADKNNTITEIRSQDLIDYIKHNFYLSYIKMNKEDNSFIKLTEFLLIRSFSPKYNREGKNEEIEN